ncbi:MAG: hypothetical protein R3310_04885 [Candidatus Competibacteraceae bacterium]|nr:hypothetical protein [Candidatus Competibacteraceae bacterium]
MVGIIAGGLATLGSLSSLVEAASLVFIMTFAVVNLIAADKVEDHTWLPWSGAALSAVIGLTLIGRLVVRQPLTLTVLLLFAILVFVARPWLLRKMRTV